MKAMYPLLADAYALNQALNLNEAEAGRCVGLFSEPLETAIAKAKKRFKPATPRFQLAKHLEDQITTIKDPSFFGHWK